MATPCPPLKAVPDSSPTPEQVEGKSNATPSFKHSTCLSKQRPTTFMLMLPSYLSSTPHDTPIAR